MMALYAVARDSFREAQDRKISRVLFGVSLLLTVALLVMGLREVPVETLVEHALREARQHSAVTVERAGTRSVDLILAPAREGGLGGDDDERPSARLEEAARATKGVLERRGATIRALSIATPGRGVPPRARLDLDYDYRNVRGAAGLGLPGKTIAELDWDMGFGHYAGMSGRQLVISIQGTIASTLAGWVGLIIVIIATAGFVPSMLAGGTAHLFLAKPVSRATLLLGKYLGGVAYVVFHASVVTLLTTGALFVRDGYFDARFLAAPLAIGGMFAVLYSVSCLAGILFETPVVSIMGTLGFWFTCFLVTGAKDFARNMELTTGKAPNVPAAFQKVADGLYYVLPKITDMGHLFERFLSEPFLTSAARLDPDAALVAKLHADLDPFLIIWTSAVYTLGVLVLSWFAFRRRDY